jgi:hypothetical protein
VALAKVDFLAAAALQVAHDADARPGATFLLLKVSI